MPPPPPPIRLAILETDTPIGSTLSRYGSYSGVFAHLFQKAAAASGGGGVPAGERLWITGWDVINYDGGEGEEGKEGKEGDVNGDVKDKGFLYGVKKRRKGYPKMGDIDAVLVTGSRYNAYDNDPWILRVVEFTKAVLASDRVKFIGVCWGQQILGRALGAKVAKAESGEWEVSVCRVVNTERGKELFGGKDALDIFQSHLDLVYHCPAGVEQLGSSGSCQVQGMYIPKKAIALQGHPEFTEEIMAELLTSRYKRKIFSEETYREGMTRVGESQDGVLVAQTFLKFLEEE